MGISVTYSVLDADGQLEWACADGGYTDGDGCVWFLTEEAGWSGASAPRSSTSPRPYEDGVYDGPTYQPGRTVVLGGRLLAPGQMALHRAMDRLSSLLAVRTRVGVLRADEPHMSRQSFVRRGGEVLVARTMEHAADWNVQLFAADPRRYGTTVHTAITGLPAFGDGWSYNRAYPYQYGEAGQSGRVDAVNAGTTETWPKFTIHGPVVDPSITHNELGLQLAFTINLRDGETLVVDAGDKTVRLNDQASRRDTLAARADWWSLAPGSNLHTFNARSSDGGASLTVEWQDAWS